MFGVQGNGRTSGRLSLFGATVSLAYDQAVRRFSGYYHVEKLTVLSRAMRALSQAPESPVFHRILLAAITSGLDWLSAASLFRYDKAAACLVGKMALGPNTEEHAKEIRKTLDEGRSFDWYLQDAETRPEPLDSIHRQVRLLHVESKDVQCPLLKGVDLFFAHGRVHCFSYCDPWIAARSDWAKTFCAGRHWVLPIGSQSGVSWQLYYVAVVDDAFAATGLPVEAVELASHFAGEIGLLLAEREARPAAFQSRRMISHDLRGAASDAKSLIEIFLENRRRGRLSDEHFEDIKKALAHLKLADETITRVLQQSFAAESVNLCELAQNVVQAHQTERTRRDVRFDQRVETAYGICRGAEVELALCGLILNATDWSIGDSPIVVRVEACAMPRSGSEGQTSIGFGRSRLKTLGNLLKRRCDRSCSVRAIPRTTGLKWVWAVKYAISSPVVGWHGKAL